MAGTSKNEVTIGQQSIIGFQIAGIQKSLETRAQLSFALLRSEIYRTLVVFLTKWAPSPRIHCAISYQLNSIVARV
jgi:hypothetical protein